MHERLDDDLCMTTIPQGVKSGIQSCEPLRMKSNSSRKNGVDCVLRVRRPT